MSGTVEQSIHEVDFCGQVTTAVAAMHAQDPNFPFAEARLEGFGTGAAKRKRKDLRFFEPGGKLALCGEVKLPGTPEGRLPLATAYRTDRTERNMTFDAKVQQWLADQDWVFVRNDADQWRAALNNMAKKLGSGLSRREPLQEPNISRILSDLRDGRASSGWRAAKTRSHAATRQRGCVC